MQYARRCAELACITIMIANASGAPAEVRPLPWKVNRPIVTMEKSVFIECKNPKEAAWCGLDYIGPKLEMYLMKGAEGSSDVHTQVGLQFSSDNGRTWSDSKPLPDSLRRYKGIAASETPFPHPVKYDPRSNMVVGFKLRQLAANQRYYHTTYYMLSADLGRTWTEPKQLQYERGESFDPENPLKPGYIENNQAAQGQSVLLHSNRTLVYPLCTVNVPKDAPDPNPHKLDHWHIRGDYRGIASLCMIGTWAPEKNDYQWTAGQPVWVPRHVSLRGLLEPDLAELQDGRILVTWRGTNTAMTPGHVWHSFSEDGGKTLSEVKPWTYDDGEAFYSPSASQNFLRHSNGKLYWLGNICGSPPSDNGPRYPLILGEVDLVSGLLKKDTVTAIDDRQPHHSPAIQFSNFKFFEDRETHAIQIYLTAYGENNVWTHANCYQYTLTPTESPPARQRPPGH